MSTAASSYSYRRLLALAWPLILGTAANSAMMFTDRVFLSRVGPEAIAAAFPAGVSAYFGACFFQAAAQYVATFAAQHEGAGERRECGPWVWQGLIVALAAGLANATLIPFLPAIFGLMHPEPAVLAAMVTLGSWLFANACSVCVIAAIGGFFAGTGRPRVVLALNGSLLALNAWLNWCLIFGHCGLPRLGIAGSAIGTVTATAVIALVALALLLRRPERVERATWPPALATARLARFCRFALPQGARQVVDISGWELFAFAVGSFGTVALAANNIVITWNLLTFIPMMGLSQAIGVAVGQAMGADDLAAARAVGRRGLALQLGYGLAIGAGYLVFTDPMIAAFVAGDHDGDGRGRIAAVARHLFIVAALWNVGDALNMAFSGALGGAGDTRWPFGASLVCSSLLLVAPLIVLLAIPAERWDRLGLERVTVAWAITLAYVTVNGAVLALRYRAGAWERMSVRST
jgi:MATE family multidrug resistance protein